MQKEIDLHSYEILTYIHSKGSSKAKKNTQSIKDWTEYMRYFTVERLDQAKKAFQEGYFLYGVNLFKGGHPTIPDTQFHYSGNFIVVNLEQLSEKIKTTECGNTYFSIEMFWGKLCPIEKAFCAHQSEVNHYEDSYPSLNYIF